MQYLNKHFKNLNSNSLAFKKHDGVINLNRTLQICFNRAAALYSHNLYFDIPSVPMFTETPAEDIIKHIFFMLEKYYDPDYSLKIRLEKQTGSDTAQITIMSNDIIVHTIEVELYTDTPGVVVKASSSDNYISEVTEEVIKCVLRMRPDKI